MEEKQVFKVVCPGCKNRLTIPYMEGIIDKLLACPVCHFKAKVAVYMQGSAAQGGSGSSDEPTQMNLDSYEKRNKKVGSLYLDKNEFPLKKGRTLIGRKAESSTADLQLPVEDRYMSRVHAAITTQEGATGLEHHLEAMNPKNPIRLNGQVIEQGDVVPLNWGDTLRFGHTELLFQLPKYYQEETDY